MKITITAALLATLCGQAMGQITVDGKIGAAETGLYTRAWIQNQPTSFGDNLPQMGQPEDNSDAVNVTTGVELRIPLSNFALSDAVPTGQIRIAGWIISGGNDFMSNQVIGGLGGLTVAGSTFCGCTIAASWSRRGSGTVTTPTLGSIVQNG